MDKLISTIDHLNERVGRVVSWLTALLVLLVCYDVLFRYVFRATQVWIMELEWHLFALIFLLGAGYTLKHDRHVRVDLFYVRFSRRDQAWVNLIGGLFFLLPWSILIIYLGINYGLESLDVKEGSPDPGGLPARYLIKFSIAAGFVLLFLQGVSEVLKAIRVLTEKTPQES